MSRRKGSFGAMTVTLGLVLAACGGGQGTFEPGDLAGIVIQPEDAPDGTQHVQSMEGSVALASLWVASTDGSRIAREMLGSGFVDAARRQFEGGTLASPDAALAISLAILFEDEESARGGRDLTVEGFMSDERGTSTEISADGLGDEAAGVGGLYEPSNPEVSASAFVWRIGNLVLVAYGAGAIDEAGVRELAERMNERAS